MGFLRVWDRQLPPGKVQRARRKHGDVVVCENCGPPIRHLVFLHPDDQTLWIACPRWARSLCPA